MRMTLPALILGAALIPAVALAQGTTGNRSTGSTDPSVTTPGASGSTGGTGALSGSRNPGGVGSATTGGDNQIRPPVGGGRGSDGSSTGSDVRPGVMPPGAPGTTPGLNPPSGGGSNTN
jgi:hypothetical protein